MSSFTGSGFGVQNNVREFMQQVGLNALPSALATGVPGNVRHSPENLMIHTIITLDSPLSIVLGTTGARAGGVKLLDMPACRAAIQASRIRLANASLSLAAASSTAGEVGLGTVIGSGAVAVLGGTATFEDICEGGLPAMGNIAAAGNLGSYVTGDSARVRVGNLAAPWAIHINAATTLATAATPTNFVIAAGSQFEFWWQCIRP